MYRQVLALREVLDQEHPSTFASMTSLVNALRPGQVQRGRADVPIFYDGGFREEAKKLEVRP